MSEEANPKLTEKGTQPLNVQREQMAAQTEQLNQLLHELENMVDDEQHALLTNLFAERAVLTAMKVRMEMDKAKGGQ